MKYSFLGAEITHSVADFGTNVSLVERKLEEIFQVASRWRAILLFDEADIFLEARATEGNLDRNAMASGWLPNE
jgi:SpoVK/Ycf46/Vps4 family AAA+-type ATPase